jgi:hypothetical protein
VITNLQTNQASPFRVVGRMKKAPSEGPEWGVECLEQEWDFWGVSFPVKSPKAGQENLIDVMLECTIYHLQEMAQLTLE